MLGVVTTSFTHSLPFLSTTSPLSLSAFYHATGFYGAWLSDVFGMMLIGTMLALITLDEVFYECFRSPWSSLIFPILALSLVWELILVR